MLNIIFVVLGINNIFTMKQFFKKLYVLILVNVIIHPNLLLLCLRDIHPEEK
jgi:hypothetical protein